MPVEKSGQDEFDFQYGDDFGEHIEKFDPFASKVLVRYNPDGDAEMNKRQLGPAQAARRLAARPRPPVPVRAARARRAAAARVGRRRHRPLRRRAAARADAARDRGHPGLRHRGRHLEDRGRRHARGRRDAVRADRARARAARTSRACCWAAARATRRSTTGCSRPRRRRGLHRLRDRPLDLVGRAEGLPRRDLEREAAAEQIADNYQRFIKVYDDAEAGRASDAAWRSYGR